MFTESSLNRKKLTKEGILEPKKEERGGRKGWKGGVDFLLLLNFF
jgi:hypothetical protein